MINILTFNGDIRDVAEIFTTNGEESDVYSTELSPANTKVWSVLPLVVQAAEFEELGPIFEEIKDHDSTVLYGDRGGGYRNQC